MQETHIHPWVGKIPLEKGMATHSNILAWRSLWTEEKEKQMCLLELGVKIRAVLSK